MRLLWLCNVVPSQLARALSMPEAASGGWLTGATQFISQNPDIELIVCFPQRQSSKIISGKLDDLWYFGYPARREKPHVYSRQLERVFVEIIHASQPEMVHIWGTEYAHSLAMVRAFHNPSKTMIHLQGLCGYIAKHYMAFLSNREQASTTLRDFLRGETLKAQQKKFARRGRFEAEAIRNVCHVDGRTNWDLACVRQTAPDICYHQCNETLRNSFYQHAGAWTIEQCEKHSIFVSQAGYPVKGFHMAIEALAEVKKRFPNAKLYTTGKGPYKVSWWRISGYQKVIKKQIDKLNLRDDVVFLGRLDEEQMCRRFLMSHVFVSASSIENSPNSVGEAMLLGVPTVASYVGGTMDLMKDGEEGLLYQADAPYMLAEYICRVFEDDALAKQLGQNATRRACRTHDPESNLNKLVAIYREVSQS